jgi:hypothetical protein
LNQAAQVGQQAAVQLQLVQGQDVEQAATVGVQGNGAGRIVDLGHRSNPRSAQQGMSLGGDTQEENHREDK